jgi:septation ring formation regulator EzrA
MNHVTWLENMLVQAKLEEAHANRSTEHRHLTTERAYVAAYERVATTRDRLAQLRQMVIDQKSLIEACENEVCQQLSDMSDEHMEWRQSRQHCKDGVNNQ